jgi:hypothetical protein
VLRRAILAGVLVLLAASPVAAQIRKFKDWLAACDNQRNCAAYSLNRGSYHAYLKIERGGTPSADATLTLAIMRELPVTFRLETDDQGTSPWPDGPIADAVPHKDGHFRHSIERPAAAVANFVRKATKLGVIQVDPPPKDDDEANIDNIYLEGAHEALAWIDAQQKRAGTETAFVKRGPKSREAVPPAPDLPVITVAKPDATPIPKQHPAEVTSRGNATCGKGSIDVEHKDTVRLGGGLLLYSFLCGQHSGASNTNYAYLLMPDGTPKAAVKPRFVLPPAVARHIKLGDHKLVTSKAAVYNPDFDADKQELSSFFGGRGAGDCGEIIDWIWNGREFQVRELRLMPDCEGIPSSDFPVIYRAQVGR